MTTKCKIEASSFCCVRFILNGIVTCFNTDTLYFKIHLLEIPIDKYNRSRNSDEIPIDNNIKCVIFTLEFQVVIYISNITKTIILITQTATKLACLNLHL